MQMYISIHSKCNHITCFHQRYWIAVNHQVGRKDSMHHAAPDTCGHVIDVPDTMLNPKFLPLIKIGDQLAMMSTPEAIRSGYNIKK